MGQVVRFPIVPRPKTPTLQEFVCTGRPDFLARLLRAHHGWSPEFALSEARRLMAMTLPPLTATDGRPFNFGEGEC